MAADNDKRTAALDTCPVCGASLDGLNVLAHHNSHFDLRAPVQNWDDGARAHSNALLAEHERRSA